DRITHMYPYLTTFFRDPYLRLIYAARLTGHAHYLKSLPSEDGCKDPAFFQKPYAGGDPDFLCPNLPCKLHDLLYPGIFAVMLILYLFRCHHDFMVLRILVTLHGVFQHLRIQMCGHTKLREIRSLLFCITALYRAVNT